MNFDLRLPIGMLFSFYGFLLVGYGLITRGSTIYERSLGMNINLGWGFVLLLFGAFMLALGLRGRSLPPQKQTEPLPESKIPVSKGT